MTDLTEVSASPAQPDYVTVLELAYGAPSQNAFGSAVFYEGLPATADLEQAALAKYRFFVGALWERYGEAAWMGPWQAVYTRPQAAPHNIVAELRAMKDREAALSASLILDNIDDLEKARAALAAAFDDPAVTELIVYKLGDGAALSGIMVVGQRQALNETIFLIFLMD